MLSFFAPLREITTLSVTVRMLLAVLCGGLIGIERERKRRPAGFRTHILICVGAAVTTLTGQYLALYLNSNTDIARLGAQVITGVGFIGAGTIIVTRRQRVKGLTTAAGLWVAAIIGLAIGSGFIEGAVFTTVIVLLAEICFSRLEYYLMKNAPEINLYVEYVDQHSLENVLKLFHADNLHVLNMEIARSRGSETHNATAIFTLRLNKQYDAEKVVSAVNTVDGIITVEEF